MIKKIFNNSDVNRCNYCRVQIRDNSTFRFKYGIVAIPITTTAQI